VPERLTVCGLPLALSLKLSDAVSALASDGVKETLVVQLPPAAIDPLQLVATSAKSAELAPVIVTPVMLNAAVPPLVKVTT
jgi:hypothetical protein